MRARLTAVAVAVAVAASVTLTACTSPTYDVSTRGDLRQHVLTVAEASAAADWQAALTALDAMATKLAAAHEEGRVSEERFETIVLAMELVRQDLDAAIAAAADEAERVRLIEEQARLQEQIDRLQDARVLETAQDDPSGGSGGNGGENGKGDPSNGGKGDRSAGNGKDGENGKGKENGG